MNNEHNSTDYLRLFFQREKEVVLGKHRINLWILTSMLLFTFLAIAFSNASLAYLRQKMDDPFTNWVNIPTEDPNVVYMLQEDFGEDSNLREQFHIEQFSVDNSCHYIFFASDPQRLPYVGCLFFRSFTNNPLISAILTPENIVGDCALDPKEFVDEMLGVIITRKQMENMGYTDPDHYPAFIRFHQASDGAQQYGVTLYDGYAMVPVPVLAVVNSLPMNMDIIAPYFFYAQQQSESRPFNLNNPDYAMTLNYAIEGEKLASEVSDYIESLVDDDVDVEPTYMPYNRSFKPTTIVSATGAYDDLEPEFINDLDRKVRAKFGEEGITRVYEFDFSLVTPQTGKFVSVQFNSKGLKKIRQFSKYLNETYHIDIEMSQINSKENFSAVSVTATILTWTIVFFALISVVLFIVNLLRTYFQRVKRNMGTFKAFGMSNSVMIHIYIRILLEIVCLAVVFSIAAVLVLQVLMSLCHIVHEGGMPFLNILSLNTFLAVAVVLISTVATVHLVMKEELRATPGDLIYDR